MRNGRKQSFQKSNQELMAGRQDVLQNRYQGVGFNVKKRAKRLIKLVPLGVGSNMQAINRIEQDLLRDIKDIDNMLHKQQSSLAYINGFLFSRGTSRQLTKELCSALQQNRDAVESGFYLCKLKEHNHNYEVVSSKLVNSPPHFPKKLLDKSIQNLHNYDRIKNQQSMGLARQRWNNSVNVSKIPPLGRMRRLKTEFQEGDRQEYSHRKMSNVHLYQLQDQPIQRKMTEHKQISLIEKSHSHPLQFITELPSTYTKKQEQNQTPSLQELTLMLKKEEDVVSIWHPPSTCPLILGVMSIEIKERSYNARSCLIKKYYWSRHALSRRLFDSILKWICLQYESVIQLTVVTDRDSFNGLFSSMGWHLGGWVSEDKVKIIYNNF